MLCGECGKSEATVFFKRIANNQLTQLALCGPCAQKKGLETVEPGAVFQELLSQFGLLPARTARPPAALKCPDCGLRFSQFQQSGRLGCAACYPAFRRPLEALLKRIHGSTRHAGKRPPRAPAPAASAAPREGPDQLDRLKRALKTALQAEDFEEAARLRDRIKESER